MNNNRGLWRGKRVDNGEWVSGDLIQIPKLDGHGKVDGTKPAIMERTPAAACYYVAPSTLGECTGLTDSNEKLAFEDDLIKYFDSIGVIKYGEYKQPFNDDESTKHIGFYIYWLNYRKQATLRADLGYWMEFAEIVGNIHDDPGLLVRGVSDGG